MHPGSACLVVRPMNLWRTEADITLWGYIRGS